MFGYIYCANFSKIYSSETGYTTTFPVALPVSSCVFVCMIVDSGMKRIPELFLFFTFK
ncbi:hypothetical protein Hanom_Chr15g01392241 [Helianthus anomalus]